MSKPTCLLICLLLCLHGKIIAQLTDTAKIKLFRQLELMQNNRPGINGWFKNGKITRADFNNPVLTTPVKTLPGKLQNLARPVPSVTSGNNTNAACFDTSLRLAYRKDKLWFANDWITKTKDGNVLIPGFEYDTSNNQVNAHLIKCTQQGDTIWSKLIKGGFSGYFVDVYKAFELADKSILLVGDISVPMPYNGRYDPMILRLTSDGDLIWQKTFKTKIWDADTTSGSIDLLDCKQDASGHLYLCGDVKSGALRRSTIAFKMDLLGNILWSNSAVSWTYPSLTGINIIGNKITFVGRVVTNVGTLPIGIVMDATTGDSLYTTAFISSSDTLSQNFYTDNMVRLTNGNLALFGRGASDGFQFGAQLHTNSGVLELTPDLQFVQSYIMQSPHADNGYSTITTVFEDGSGAFTRSGYISSYNSDVVFGTFKNNLVLKERMIPYRNLSFGWTSNFLQMDDGGQIVTNLLGDEILRGTYTEFIKLHNTDTAGSCLGTDTMAVIFSKRFFNKTNVYFDSLVTNTLIENHRPFQGVFNNSFTILSNCKQISFCDSLRLSVPKDTVCTGTPVTITIHKNKECGANPSWDYDTTAVASFLQLNDTTVTAIVNQPWQGRLLATINGCRLLQDSVRLTILQSPGVLNLGADTVICPGNTVLLNAKKGYATYQWQNGSTDSVFLVTAPGKYFVTVTDACTGSFSDTVIVSAHPPIPFYIGADTSVCNKENISITAPAGFLQYRWTGTNINNDTLSSITALPTASSWYKVTAEKIPGCFATDSLFVTIKQTPTINLGRDTSFCAGQQLLLDAGPGFSSYQWSGGQQTQQIIVSLQGSYIVKAALNGCFAYDTLQVLSVYPLPVFTLGGDTSLCQGRQLPLTVNLPQATYQWSNGSTTNTFTVTQAGTYWLKATVLGCSRSDTLKVAYTPIPLVQLGKDTSLCQGQTLLLDAVNSGATYTWQDGSAAATYTIKSQGVYSVTATLGHCMAADTIAVSYTAVPLFTLGRDTFLCTGQHLLLQPVLNTPASLLWQDGSTGPSFTVITAGTYSLLASNQCGSYTDEINILEGLCNIEMPSAFTPNGDGINDVFKVKYPFPVQQFSMIIYNRYGEKIFETSNISEGWDGKWKGMPQPLNSYVWVISFKGVNNRQQSLKGTVTIVQ